MNNENGFTERPTAARPIPVRPTTARPTDGHGEPERLALIERRMDELAAHGVVASDWRHKQADLWNMIRDGTVHSLDGHSAAAGSLEEPCAAAETPLGGDPPGRGP